MKICYLADAKSPHTQKWVRHFADRGDEVHVISFRPHDIPGATVHHVPPPYMDSEIDLLHAGRGRFQKVAYLFCAHSVRRLVKRIRPDVLHAFLATSYAFAGACSGFHPLVVSSLGSEVVVLPERSLFYRKLLRFNLKRADRVTATSRFLAAATQAYCPQGTSIDTIAFGVDSDRFSPRGRDYDDTRPVVVGTVKILEQNYGIDRLIKAFRKVIAASTDPRISLLIVGGGSLEQSLKELGHNLGVSDRITFVGNLPHEKVMDFFDQIDVFVSLPESETFGVSVVEASACGMPSVVADVGGLPEVVVDGETGFLVDPLDTDGAAARILELAGDASLRRSMGQAARELVLDRYDWKDTAARMESLYEQLVSEKSVVTP
ncbi:MAG: glycosyltransferase family 4 protein [Gaiellales bacterium]|nr:MAG: glycosyltransferase family 4 protein [Gaiellales bacterium]